jgi:hypothetical protein
VTLLYLNSVEIDLGLYIIGDQGVLGVMDQGNGRLLLNYLSGLPNLVILDIYD